jgi:hypothetical protein
MIAQNDNKNILKAGLPSNRAKALGRFFGMLRFVLGNRKIEQGEKVSEPQ